MIIVIIAGGSGTRLWPLSTGDYPKHLLSVTGEQSLLQNTFDRASRLADDIYVISEASHVQHVYAQLPDLSEKNVIVEPGRRGTASCVIAALARIKQSHSDDEPIVFMHADHHIRDIASFVEGVQAAVDASLKHQRMVLLGVVPSRPETGFGYIKRGEHANGSMIYDVKSFKEKPDKPTAQDYMESGIYLWNMGYFVAPLSVFEQRIHDHAPHLWDNYQKLCQARSKKEHDEHYIGFANEPIEYPLIEKVPDLLVVPGSFDWMDVGSFTDMHTANEQDDDGNTVQGNVLTEKLTNSYIHNQTDVPVGVIGLDNVAVVVTDTGIVVTNKSHAQDVGVIAKKVQGG